MSWFFIFFKIHDFIAMGISVGSLLALGTEAYQEIEDFLDRVSCCPAAWQIMDYLDFLSIPIKIKIPIKFFHPNSQFTVINCHSTSAFDISVIHFFTSQLLLFMFHRYSI